MFLLCCMCNVLSMVGVHDRRATVGQGGTSRPPWPTVATGSWRITTLYTYVENYIAINIPGSKGDILNPHSRYTYLPPSLSPSLFSLPLLCSFSPFFLFYLISLYSFSLSFFRSFSLPRLPLFFLSLSLSLLFCSLY